VVPEQSLLSTLSEGQVPKTNQGVPEQTTATMSSMQGGLLDAVARGKSMATSPTIRLAQKQEQASAEHAAESNDDIIEEIQGHPQDGHQHVYSAVNVGTITSATRRSPSTKRRREWSEQQDDSSGKYR
jgi:broad specificity polyphosphatase/5'/3'-nucleotidase SurE